MRRSAQPSLRWSEPTMHSEVQSWMDEALHAAHAQAQQQRPVDHGAVSYTHLTLPTKA